jgi:uncharacterized metal-binding protein
MPGVRTHDFLTLLTVATADVAYFRLEAHPDWRLAGIFTAAYVFAGYACAGDLDLCSREYRRWGPLRILWWPYQKAVPHRSRLSHGLVLGGVVRIIYLAAVSTLLGWGAVWVYGQLGHRVDPDAATGAEWRSLFGLARAHPAWTLALLAGFVLAGTTHSVADIVWSGAKRARHRFGA